MASGEGADLAEIARPEIDRQIMGNVIELLKIPEAQLGAEVWDGIGHEFHWKNEPRHTVEIVSTKSPYEEMVLVHTKIGLLHHTYRIDTTREKIEDDVITEPGSQVLLEMTRSLDSVVLHALKPRALHALVHSSVNAGEVYVGSFLSHIVAERGDAHFSYARLVDETMVELYSKERELHNVNGKKLSDTTSSVRVVTVEGSEATMTIIDANGEARKGTFTVGADGEVDPYEYFELLKQAPEELELEEADLADKEAVARHLSGLLPQN